jgi:hypothetical protein
MSRTFLVWSLLVGLALVGSDWYVEYGQEASSVAAAPSAADGLVTATDDGTPAPRPPKY